MGNVTGIQARALLLSTVVASAGIPTNLGAGTNEDVVIVAHRDSLMLLGGEPTIRVFEEVGSGTLTVRTQCYGSAALIVLNPAAVAKVTGLTGSSGF